MFRSRCKIYYSIFLTSGKRERGEDGENGEGGRETGMRDGEARRREREKEGVDGARRRGMHAASGILLADSH